MKRKYKECNCGSFFFLKTVSDFLFLVFSNNFEPIELGGIFYVAIGPKMAKMGPSPRSIGGES